MLERNILGEFDHPLLLRLYHSFQERDKLVLVVAYCPGGSLHTHVNISLKEDGRGFDEHRAAFYVAEIAQAIAHLHSHGIVHRDSNSKTSWSMPRATWPCLISALPNAWHLDPSRIVARATKTFPNDYRTKRGSPWGSGPSRPSRPRHC